VSSPFTITGVNELIASLEEMIRTVPSKQVMGEIGSYLRYAMVARSQRGENVRGQPFDSYSPGHARTRRKAGYQTAFVDLTMTGALWNALTFEAERDLMRLFFANVSDKTGMNVPEKAYYLDDMKNFEYFGISDKEEAAILDIAEKMVLEALQ